MDVYFKQCNFKNQKTNSIYTAFIPTSKAKLGKILKLKILGEWRDHWEVMSVGTELGKETLKFQEEGRRQRESTIHD